MLSGAGRFTRGEFSRGRLLTRKAGRARTRDNPSYFPFFSRRTSGPQPSGSNFALMPKFQKRLEFRKTNNDKLTAGPLYYPRVYEGRGLAFVFRVQWSRHGYNPSLGIMTGLRLAKLSCFFVNYAALSLEAAVFC